MMVEAAGVEPTTYQKIYSHLQTSEGANLPSLQR